MTKKTTSRSSPRTSHHAETAHAYAEAVIAKTVPAGGWVRKAAQRHLNDLARSESDPTWPFVFDPDVGARVCRFIEKLPHTKGVWARAKELLILQPWQCFLIVVLFGWLRRGTRLRRFRAAYWEIARKNGKTLLAAAVGLYMLMADGEFGAEVYSGATSEKQAWEVFGPARLMLSRRPKMAAKFGVEVGARALVTQADGGKFTPVIGNPGDGPSPSCAIVDEYHEHLTPSLYDSMETGMGARQQPLMLVITTAGANVAGPCHEKHSEVEKVLDRVIDNDELFGVIFGIDPEDDWADPKSLIKANPNYGVSVDAEFLKSQQRNARSSPFQQNKFKTKHLNVWTSVLAGVMNMQLWELAGDPMLEEAELAGCDCYFGLDLASKSDLCTEQRLYTRGWNGKTHFYLFGKYWLPEAAVEEDGPNAAHYAKWVKQGLLLQTDGATVDFEEVTETVIEDCKLVNPLELVYDPFNATQMAQAISAEGVAAVEFIQAPQNFALPLDEILAAVKDGRFHHDCNPITTWCFSNMVGRPTRKGFVSPSKQKPHQKIDGAVAALMAMARACAGDPYDDLTDFLANPIIS